MGAEGTRRRGARAPDQFVEEEDFAVQLREAFRRWNEGDFDGTTDLMDPEVEWHTSGVFPDLIEVYRGHEGIKRFWRDFTAPWDEIEIEPMRIEASGDDAVVDFRFLARGRGGVKVDMTIFHRFRRRDGLTRYVKSYATREEALQAAGMGALSSGAEIVSAAFAAWSRGGDLDAAFDPGFHPDVEYREDPDWPGAATYRGLETVKDTFRDYAELLQFDDSKLETVVDAGDDVVAVLRVSVRPAAASEPVVHRWGYVCRVRDGKVAFFQAYRDPSEAFAAAGIEEPAS